MARAFLISVVLGLLLYTPAVAAGPLVALGDSYSSGEGAPPFLPGTDKRGVNTCHRSTLAWPMLLGIETDRPVVPLACSGARVDHIRRSDSRRAEEGRRISQIQRLRSFLPELVTLTIGGNDVGFAEVLATCANPLQRRCDRLYRKGARDELEQRITDLEQLLPQVYRDVSAAAPGARLAVVGYPRIFPRTPALLTCAWMAPAELRYLNAKAKSLNAAIGRAAAIAQVAYIDVEDALENHELSCRPRSWVNPFKASRKKFPYSFHPNRDGQRAIADAVERGLRRVGLGTLAGARTAAAAAIASRAR